MKSVPAFAVACALLGGCVVAPYDDGGFRERHYGESHGSQRVYRDPIPYRYDGDYHRGDHDRDGNAGHHDEWR